MDPELFIFWFGFCISLIFGMGFGGFATTGIARLPHGVPWIGDKPRCFMCKSELKFLDYVSILSLVLWRGKCRYCKESYELAIGYFLTEIAITAAFVLCFVAFGFSELYVLIGAAAIICVMIAVIDAEHQKIPAVLLIMLLCLGLVYRTWIDKHFYDLCFSAAGAALVILMLRHAYYTLKGRPDIGNDYLKYRIGYRFGGPGFDYVKLYAIMGIWLPIMELLYLTAITLPLIILWNLIHPKTLRLGTILAVVMWAGVYYLHAGI